MTWRNRPSLQPPHQRRTNNKRTVKRRLNKTPTLQKRSQVNHVYGAPHRWIKIILKKDLCDLREFVLAEGEKPGEDKEKEKRDEMRTSSEATEAREKTEASDLKRGAVRCLKMLK